MLECVTVMLHPIYLFMRLKTKQLKIGNVEHILSEPLYSNAQCTRFGFFIVGKKSELNRIMFTNFWSN